jgi:hypothetical protein
VSGLLPGRAQDVTEISEPTERHVDMRSSSNLDAGSKPRRRRPDKGEPVEGSSVVGSVVFEHDSRSRKDSLDFTVLTLLLYQETTPKINPLAQLTPE